MYKENLALNNLKWLTYHQIKPEITDKPTENIISCLLDIKLDTLLKKKTKSRKSATLHEIPPEIWKTKFDIFSYAMPCINKTNLRSEQEAAFYPFSKKDKVGSLGTTEAQLLLL